MPNKMLIDASHPEETRVVVVRGSRIEEFDFESQNKKQLRGNIYLARVTRVEPSLQAAFVEYGGNRHGFLAFSEIHPDYYQIPVADRQALLKAEAEENASEEDEDSSSKPSSNGRKRRRNSNRKDAAKKAADPSETVETDITENAPSEISEDTAVSDDNMGDGDDSTPDSAPDDSAHNGTSMAAAAAGDVISEEIIESATSDNNGDNGSRDSGDDGNDEASEVDTVGAGDALDEVHTRRRPVRRQYKIQEVIKRRQILLVQVVKEERGNKGAALTTYLSLAGRYSVLMPNTARGGGISRKITNPQDRKRLKEVVKGLEVPEGMGVILRTAGENRTKPEIKRDYDYLMRLWESVRTLTLKSIAPALVYEEGSLIKRAVRDLYNKDIDQIQVAGEEAYREAKDFMRMLMPSHAKVVQPYRDPQPIFARNGIEAQLDKILQPQVTLKSGGYIIINQTEALVAIDVNSGRSTKEHSIEDTALQTNLEAAEEVARQLRLRDLAGLIVIDFIDMDEGRNNRAVEKRLKDCLKNDRARIQVGRISHFGLLEMSRQRIRSSVLESTMQPCPHCHGTGQLRSDSSLALLVVRAIEDFLLKDARYDIVIRASTSTALYLLNQKRLSLIELENRFGVSISVETDDNLGHQHYAIVKGELSSRPAAVIVQPAQAPEADDQDVEDEDLAESEADSPAARQADGQATISNGEDNGSSRKRRRKRRRRGGRDRNGTAPHEVSQEGVEHHSETVAQPDEHAVETADESSVADGPVRDEPIAAVVEEATTDSVADEDAQRGKRQRGRRGGRRSRGESDSAAPSASAVAETVTDDKASEAVGAPEPSPVAVEAAAGEAATETAPEAEAKPKPKPRRPRVKKEKTVAAAAETTVSKTSSETVAVESPAEPEMAPASAKTEAKKEAEPAAAKPAPRTRRKAATVEEKSDKPVVSSTESAPEEPRKSGWWQRKSFF